MQAAARAVSVLRGGGTMVATAIDGTPVPRKAGQARERDSIWRHCVAR